MEDSKDVIDSIAQAFKGSHMPRTNRELAPMGIDADCVIRNFLGRTREQIEAEFKAHIFMEDFSYMSPTGAEYYLPTALRLMIRQPWDCELWIYVYSYLRPRDDGEPWWNLGGLSKKQLNAVEKWARFLHEEWSANPPDYIDPAEAESLAKLYGRLARAKSPIESNRRKRRPS